MVLRATCPADLAVLVAPFDFQPTRQRSFQPDLLVDGELTFRRTHR
jgi:hypothetical protein